MTGLSIDRSAHKTAFSLARAIAKAIGGDRGHMIERSLESNATPETMVRAFHGFYDMPAPASYTELDPQRLAMRAGLVVEELQEFFYKALGITMTCQFTTFTDADKQEEAEKMAREELQAAIEHASFFDPIEAADAGGDSVYVWFGLFIEMGISLMPVLREIHAANMTKPDENGNVIRRADGKVMKGPFYMEPNIAQVLSGLFDKGITPQDREELFPPLGRGQQDQNAQEAGDKA